MNWKKNQSQDKNRDIKKNYVFAKWMSFIFLALSALLLSYTFYRAEIYYNGASTMYFKYYLISFSGIIFWGVVLIIPASIRANIVTITTSLVIGLYMIEVFLTYFQVQDPLVRARIVEAKRLGIDYDRRTKFEMIEDLIEQGLDAVPSMGPKLLLASSDKILPLGGISNRTTVATNENGYYMVYLSDRYGFNNPDSEWDSKQVEWLLTGDSFTEGLSVRPGENIAGQIRAITNQSTINLGRAGNGPLMELAELIEYAEAIKPRKVIWVYYEENDLRGDIQRDKSKPFLMRYMEEGFSQDLVNRQTYIDDHLGAALVEFQEQSVLGKTRWIRLYQIRELIGFDNDKNNANEVEVEVEVEVKVDIDDPLFAKILTRAKTRVASWGGELYFVYLPEYGRYNSKKISNDSFRKKAEVLEVVKNLKIPVIDIDQEVFAVHPDLLSMFPFRLEGHYNAVGYSEVAKAIVQRVMEHEKNNK